VTERRDINSRLENWSRLFHRQRSADQQDRRTFDELDAHLLERAMQGLPTLQRSLLWWCYVRMETPEQVARRIGLQIKPTVLFVDAFRHAQAAAQHLVGLASLSQKH
jgi:DNA-directed RNA polymerase specialized sigma24 family protein